MALVRNMTVVLAVALSLAWTRIGWTADSDESRYNRMRQGGSGQSLYEPDESNQTTTSSYQPLYQSSGSSASSNIIGYKPISESALSSGLPGSASSQSRGTTLGVSEQSKAGKAKLPSAYLTGILGDGPYTLGRDDAIHVDVRSQPEFSGDYVVGFDGRIQYNYIGDVPVGGLTKYEVQQVLEKLLGKYIRVPSVTVTIVAYNSKVVYVIGEVNHPGKFVMRGDAIKLREAILAAGLPTHDAALGRVHVIKPDLNDPHVRVVNMKRILYQGQLKDDVDLYPGEIVVVPSTVLSKVNDFLASLLSPITRAASVAALAAL